MTPSRGVWAKSECQTKTAAAKNSRTPRGSSQKFVAAEGCGVRSAESGAFLRPLQHCGGLGAEATGRSCAPGETMRQGWGWEDFLSGMGRVSRDTNPFSTQKWAEAACASACECRGRTGIFLKRCGLEGRGP